MRELLILLNVKAQTLLKGAFNREWQDIARNLSTACIFGGFAIGVFVLSRSTTTYLLQDIHIGQFLFHRFLAMLLYVLFITVNLGNMIVSYATLYKSDEVRLLMALPVSHTKIFIVKFIDNFFYSSTTLLLVGFSVLLGYGSCFTLPWYFYFFTIFFVMGPFMLIAGLIAVLMLMSFISVAARIGVRKLLTLITLLYLGAIYAYFRIINPIQLVQDVMKNFPDVDRYFADLDPPFTKFLPNYWVSEFLYWETRGEYAAAVPYFAILFLTMLALGVIAILVAQRVYYRSWLAAADALAVRVSSTRTWFPRVLDFARSNVFRPQTDVILRRDFWLFFREPSQWLHLVLMIVLILVFLVSISTLQLKLSLPFHLTLAYLIVFLFNGFLVASITLRFVFPLVSLEGETFWSVRASPVLLQKLYRQKLALSSLFVIPTAVILSVTSVMMLRNQPSLVLVAGLGSAMISFSLIALNLGAGSYFAVYSERNPIRVASSQGASLTFLGSMGYLAIIVAILIVPLNTHFHLLVTRNRETFEWIWMPLAGIAGFSLSLAWLFSRIGLRSLKRDF